MLLQDFKKEAGVDKITVLKGKGRMFADVKTGNTVTRLFFSQDADLKKPLYVNPGAHGALWVGNNQGAEAIAQV